MKMNTTLICPDCGRRFRVTIVPDEPRSGGIFDRLFGEGEFEISKPWEPSLTQPSAMTPSPSSEHLDWREAPAGTPTVSGHVAVPALQTLGSTLAFAIGTAAIGIAIMMGRWPIAMRWWVGLTGSVLVVSWFILLFDTRKLLRVIESFIKIDLDGDGRVGQPEEEWIRGEVTDADRRQTKRIEFPFPPDALREVAVAVLREEHSFAREALSHVVSSTQFRRLQREFLRRGLCHWKNPDVKNLGVGLTVVGRAFLRLYLPK